MHTKVKVHSLLNHEMTLITLLAFKSPLRAQRPAHAMPPTNVPQVTISYAFHVLKFQQNTTHVSGGCG